MSIQANAEGVLSGRFTIPANIPAGTKSVAITGVGGSQGETSYTGNGTIITNELTRIVTRIRGFDPLAQTFSLEVPHQVAGVDVWFTTIGEKDVRVQLRETTTGLPNQEVLAESTLTKEQLTLNGTTRFEFPPVYLNAAQEYALVILTDDPSHEVAIAELGKYDQQHGWVTSQPYQVGVLLSSSNAQTWTPHQNSDLAFRLLAAEFTDTTEEVPLGSCDAENVSDLLLLAGIQRTVANTDVIISATTESGDVYRLQEDQPLNLSSRLSGDIALSAELRGTSEFSPVLLPGIQVAKGDLIETADYVSRAFPAGTDVDVKVTFEASLSGVAKVDVFAEIDGEWQPLELDATNAVENGWRELSYKLDNITSTSVRIKLELAGTAQDRPRVRRLRAITI